MDNPIVIGSSPPAALVVDPRPSALSSPTPARANFQREHDGETYALAHRGDIQSHGNDENVAGGGNNTDPDRMDFDATESESEVKNKHGNIELPKIVPKEPAGIPPTLPRIQDFAHKFLQHNCGDRTKCDKRCPAFPTYAISNGLQPATEYAIYGHGTQPERYYYMKDYPPWDAGLQHHGLIVGRFDLGSPANIAHVESAYVADTKAHAQGPGIALIERPFSQANIAQQQQTIKKRLSEPTHKRSDSELVENRRSSGIHQAGAPRVDLNQKGHFQYKNLHSGHHPDGSAQTGVLRQVQSRPAIETRPVDRAGNARYPAQLPVFPHSGIHFTPINSVGNVPHRPQHQNVPSTMSQLTGNPSARSVRLESQLQPTVCASTRQSRDAQATEPEVGPSRAEHPQPQVAQPQQTSPSKPLSPVTPKSTGPKMGIFHTGGKSTGKRRAIATQSASTQTPTQVPNQQPDVGPPVLPATALDLLAEAANHAMVELRLEELEAKLARIESRLGKRPATGSKEDSGVRLDRYKPSTTAAKVGSTVEDRITALEKQNADVASVVEQLRGEIMNLNDYVGSGGHRLRGSRTLK